ncbi:mannan-binding lectin [Pseudoalteromonas xiamenensis]|uniref:mannan-binding lectin n=1 Tax=Pseudoalteromonas xiamenensis TaxID=882626 RepID=UPI0027E52B07|nr:mannan-binding lectin [Pseudoalteromonas xiamenensis]WMN59990.1 mannan-binding lectin [Pseudoalteromonas xiamenensis]
MSKSNGKDLNFLDPKQYAVLEFDSEGKPLNSCDNKITGSTIRNRLQKAKRTAFSTAQAGDGATIYAQDGNVIYYEVRFNKSLCDQTGSAVELAKQNQTNFLAGTTEIKTAWKVLSNDEAKSNQFVVQQQKIAGKKQTLGLVGMHIAVATENHPEFVWATFEHKVNAPDCAPTAVTAKESWTFASHSCASGLSNSATAGNVCNFNNPSEEQTAATGTPTNICRVYPYGTGAGDLFATDNLTAILDQNSDLDTQIDALKSPSTYAVLKNYFQVGALWVSDIGKNTGGKGVPNERGSLRLANTVAETTYQHVNLNSNFASNCFGCHNFIGTENRINNNITSQSLSHIFLDIVVGQGKAADVSAQKVIVDNSMAQGVCQGTDENLGVCPSTASFLKWNGQWTNSNSSAGSVCGCVMK